METKSSYTKREWILLVALSVVQFGNSLSASLQAPFYPQEAEKKGASPSEYGLVFGIFELVTFLSAPFFGKYIGLLGAERLLKGGIFVAGTSLILFGMLNYIEGHVWFIALSFLVRILESLGVSAVYTATLSIQVVVFPDTFARVFTMLQIFQGLGFMVGPTVGGLLFEVGGFTCPFVSVGALVIINGVIISFTLPKIERPSDQGRPKTSIIKVLKVVPILLAVFSMMVEAVNLGFLLATLEPHLREFNLTPTALGAMFVISGLVYTVVSPLVGVVCDRLDTKKMIVIGSIINIISFLFIGPVPFTPISPTLWLIGIGLFLDGLGAALVFVPAFVEAIMAATKYGLPDDITTYALVSGCYSSAFSLGAFVGPSMAGVLYQLVGFRPGTLFVIALQLLLIISMSWFLCIEKSYDERNIGLVLTSVEDDDNMTETQPLAATVGNKRPDGYNTIGTISL